MAMTNAEIIESYKIINKITCPIHTYAKWKSLGYQVKRGEKSEHKICIWKSCPKKVMDESTNMEVTSNRMFMKTAYFFTMNQVERIG